MLSDDTRELEPAKPEGTEPTKDEGSTVNDSNFGTKHKELEQENKVLKKKVTDLTILIYQVLDQDESDFFDDNVRTIERQNIRRMLKARFPLTSEMVEIVNKSRETQSSSTQSVT